VVFQESGANDCLWESSTDVAIEHKSMKFQIKPESENVAGKFMHDGIGEKTC
jgi:hypothetical protein